MTLTRLQNGFVSLLLVGTLTAATLVGKKLIADKTRSTVTYTMHHPLHTWDGVSHEVNCALLYDEASKTMQSVAVAIKVASFDSKDGNRDSHALEVLDGIRYPNVTFVSQQIQKNADGTLNASGKLTFHGITKPTSIVCTQKDEGSYLIVSGAFDIKMTEFNIEQPSLLGMKTDDPINIKFTTYFTR